MKGDPVYISLPSRMSGFQPDHVLKLNKSLYGQVDAPRMWYDKLRAGLETRGFTACKADPCLFNSKKVIRICYVDDCLCLLQIIRILMLCFNCSKKMETSTTGK